MIVQADKDLPLPSGTLRTSETARNLGVIIDQQLSADVRRARSRLLDSMLLSPPSHPTDQAIH